MIREEQVKLLKELGKSHYGNTLKNYLSEKIIELNDVSSCESFDDVLGRKKAIKIVKELFNFMEDRKVIDKGRENYL